MTNRERIDQTRSRTSHAWLMRSGLSSEADIRLFCFPHSGASTTVFASWPDQIPAKIEVCPVQLPGRGSRITEPLFTRLQPLVDEAVQALRPCLDRPFAFFGHSLGGLVSFELARALKRSCDRSPIHLFISGHTAPHLPDKNPPISLLPDPEFIDKLRELNGTPQEVLENEELLELILPVLRADFEVSETYIYQPGEPLDCPMTVFGGLQDSGVSRESLEAWRIHTRSSCMLRMLPGDHFFINTAQHLLLQVIAQDLFETMRRSRGKA